MLTTLQRALDVAVAVTILTGLLPGQDSRESRPASRRVAESRPASIGELVEAGTDLLARLKGEGSWRAANRIVQDGFAARKAGRHADAINLFERVGREFPDTHTTISWMLVASEHSDQGDLDTAVSVVERALSAASDDADRNYAYQYLAILHEKRGDWRRALDAIEKSELLEGLVAEVFATSAHRQLTIARLRFHLGEIDTALRLLEAILRSGVSDGATEDLVVRARQALTSEVATTYAEYSGRSARLADSRTFAATLPPERRALVLDSIKVVEAWLSKQPAAVMKVVA
jgi:tetratricopeptide (TPR) repeat protein